MDRGWFRTGGYINPGDSLSGWLKTMALPAFALSLPVAAELTRIVRTAVVEELDKDYVRTAIGSGLPPVVVVVAGCAPQRADQPADRARPAGRLSARRRGRHRDDLLAPRHEAAIDAVKNGDPAVVQGVVLTTATGFVVVNLAIDILYLLVNPRLRDAT